MENPAQNKAEDYRILAERKGIALPTPKTEAWKYTRLRDLFAVSYEQPETAGQAGPDVPFAADVISISNGYLHAPLPQIDGVVFKTLAGTEITEQSREPFALMNAACLLQGLRIEISKELNRPLVLKYHMSPNGKNYMYHWRNVIVCTPQARAEIVEQFTYDGEVKSCYLANIVNDINIAQNAELCHYKYQNEAFKAGHIAFNNAVVDAGGRYESFCLQKGAHIGRNETRAALNGEGAEAAVNAAYRMNGWATLDTTTDISHNCPHTTSSQIIKGVVGGEAKGVFQGRIHVAPQAVCTNGTQEHKAILLTDTAEIDVKPELEIFADDVKCSHGAASGELDKEQLFYMRARGIGEEEAKQILIDAYLNDAVNQISSAEIRDWFKSLI